MYNCRFVLNGAPMSAFTIAGLDFPPFSGLAPYTNRPEHRCVA
jgi:hypothetical protein